MAARKPSPGDVVNVGVAKLVESGDSGPLLAAVEAVELSPPTSATAPMRAAWVTLQILGYIHADDLVSAKFLWKRLPEALKEKFPTVQAANDAARLLASKEYTPFFALMATTGWGGNLQQAATAVTEAVRGRNVALLAAAYSSLTLTAATAYTGLSGADTGAYLGANGWGVEGATGMVTPPAPAAGASAAVQADVATATTALQGLISSAVAMEAPPVEPVL